MGRYTRLFLLVLSVLVLTAIQFSGTVSAQEGDHRMSLLLTYYDYNEEVIPGEENILYIRVLNSGETPLTNIRIFTDPPEGWDVRFSPASISYLDADSSKTIDVIITPDNNAPRGSHRFRVVAESDEISSTLSVYVKIVRTTTIWTWIGAGIACVVIAGFVLAYRRFSKD